MDVDHAKGHYGLEEADQISVNERKRKQSELCMSCKKKKSCQTPSDAKSRQYPADSTSTNIDGGTSLNDVLVAYRQDPMLRATYRGASRWTINRRKNQARETQIYAREHHPRLLQDFFQRKDPQDDHDKDNTEEKEQVVVLGQV
ncbi:MAG: hypothetical protein J3Q66DRAFT_440710 [Benniella sp.]|nr:MAG: hypothetical protein J3Q66DRAFT_440710 [Benniella sp.]